MAARLLSTLATLSAASLTVRAQEVTPVSKVIDLLEGLKSEVETEGASEAQAYDTFACFCKDGTKTKSDAITSGRDRIDSLSADIQEKTEEKEQKENELKKRQADHEAWTAELTDTKARFEKATAEYEAQAADLSKAISSLDSAIKAMEASKPTASLIQTVQSSLALAQAMNLITETKRKSVSTALLQVDPADPTYAFHSDGILETLNKLLGEFRTEKSDLDTEWGKAKGTFESTISGLEDKLENNQQAMDGLTSGISTLTGEIAVSRGDLVGAEALLKDDQLFLKDLTERCESRAKDWDQRSQMRADELEALSQALAIMKDTVVDRDAAANKRALLQQQKASLAPVAPHVGGAHKAAKASLIQETASNAGRSTLLLRGSHAASALLSLQHARAEHAAALLSSAGKRLSSVSLASLAGRVADGPFDKVKGLIQQLIERLLSEATAEATKKGFCDESLGKARKDRDFRHADTSKLDVEIKGLNLKRVELEEEIELLTGEISQLRDDLSVATTQRADEKTINLETIKKAKEGFSAVKQAINILKVFYARAGRAKVESLVQYSPIDEDSRSSAGFEGAYKGNQERSKGVIGMLQVIASDFDRTERHTEEAEAKAHAEFVEFDRAARADIEGKETKKTLDEEDLETTTNKIASGMDDLKSAQDLLDSALKGVELLKPTCIDTGMSYEDRVAKREDEIAALKNALCILDTDNVEAECQ